MPSRPHEGRPNFNRQRSNSVPAFGLVKVSLEEASILCSAAARATARRKRPVSVDSPGPVVEKPSDQVSLPVRLFNFSTPSRLGFETSPLRHVQRSASVHTLQSETSSSSTMVEDDLDVVEPTPLASSFPASIRQSRSDIIPASPISPRRVVEDPVLKSYAEGLFAFTKKRLNSATPETLQALGLKRDASVPATPELDINELPKPPVRPQFNSTFSDWSSTRASSVIELSSPYDPLEPRTPDDQTALMTPDSFFAEVTPRVAQTAQWAAQLSSARASSNLGSFVFLDSPTMGTQLQRTSSVTTSEAFSYFAGFDGTTEAAGTRLSNDMSPIARHFMLQQSGLVPRSTPSSSVSNHPPVSYHQQTSSPYAEMSSLSQTPSWQVSAMV